MTLNDGFNRTVSDWLHGEAGRGAPGYLDEVLSRTTRTRQRPAWSSLERWLPVDLAAHLPVAATRVAWRPIALLALLTLAIAALVLYAGSRQRPINPFGLAVNGQLAYAIDDDIYLADADRSNARVIVSGPTTDVAPVFARDGTRILFLRELGSGMVMPMSVDADGRNVVPLAPEPLRRPESMSWSPTGTQLAVLHASDRGRAVISLLDTDGTGTLRTLPLGDIVPVTWLDWRPPDGGELIFRGRPTVGSTDVSLYAIGLDGTRLRPLTPVVPEDGKYNGPTLAPDGLRLAYWNFEANAASGVVDGWTHVLSLDTQIDTQMRYADLAAEIGAVFSPDGKELVLERQAPEEPYPARLIVVPSDGEGGVVEIGPTFPYDTPHEFGFSPDGKQVVLAIEGSPTRFFRVSDGAELSAPQNMADLPSWQRLAP